MQVSMVTVLGILNVKVLRGCIRQFSLDYALHTMFSVVLKMFVKLQVMRHTVLTHLLCGSEPEMH